MMKIKKIICCLLALCIVTLMSCDNKDTDSYERVVGDYSIKITPLLNVKYGNSTVSLSAETIETTCSITAKDDKGNVFVQIDGINGMINEMSFDAYCDGIGMRLDKSSYDGIIYTSEYGIIDCDVDLKNPTVSIYNSRLLSWESSINGECEINISGLDLETCGLTGKLQFEATSISN
ncbi:MAG: hypothetical protein IJA42_06355 [Bacteroidales bacterium]|nr:hypothetical protein [Bacteroidales bacterium]